MYLKNILRKLLTAGIIFSLFTIVSCGGGGGGGDDLKPITVTAEDPNGDNGTWTIIVHIAADNDIDYNMESEYGTLSNYVAALEQAEAADTNDRLTIVVLMDACTSSAGYTSPFSTGYYVLTGGAFSADRVTGSPTAINSGSVTDSQNFLNWAVINHSSDHYMYSVFNHGGGFNDSNIAGTFGIKKFGIGFDDGSNDSLSHDELATLTAYLKTRIGKNIDLFYAYACLMGGVELAYEVRNNADYLLCSEQSFPADMWSYEALSAVASSTKTSGMGIGKAFCASAWNYYTITNPRKFTLSLIDLSKVGTLYSAVDTFASAANTFIGTSTARATLFNNAVMESYQMDYYYYIDLGGYVRAIQDDAGIDQNVKDAAAVAQTAMDECVVYQKQNGCPGAYGLTIFHNVWHKAEKYSTTTYDSILDFGTNTWTDYVTKMDSLEPATVAADSFELDNSYSSAKKLSSNGTVQNHSLHSTTDQDWISVTLPANSELYISINEYSAFYTIDGFNVDVYIYDGGLQYLDSTEGGIIPLENPYSSNYTVYLNVTSTTNSTGIYTLSAQTGTPLFSSGGFSKKNKTLTINKR